MTTMIIIGFSLIATYAAIGAILRARTLRRRIRMDHTASEHSPRIWADFDLWEHR